MVSQSMFTDYVHNQKVRVTCYMVNDGILITAVKI